MIFQQPGDRLKCQSPPHFERGEAHQYDRVTQVTTRRNIEGFVDRLGMNQFGFTEATPRAEDRESLALAVDYPLFRV